MSPNSYKRTIGCEQLQEENKLRKAIQMLNEKTIAFVTSLRSPKSIKAISVVFPRLWLSLQESFGRVMRAKITLRLASVTPLNPIGRKTEGRLE